MNADQLCEQLRTWLSGSEFVRASFAGKPRGHNPNRWQRVQLRPVLLGDSYQIQFSFFDGRKTNTKNHPKDDLTTVIAELIALQFSDIHLLFTQEEINIRVSKQGQAHLARRAVQRSEANLAHNRPKQVPLPEGVADVVLEQMGILTAAGQVKPSMRAKYNQINEFLKHLRHLLETSDLLNLTRPIEILDCGCGAAYLTIAVHHYLNNIMQRPARVVGVDVNEALIRRILGKKPEPRGTLNFVTGKIGEWNTSADIVLALHACHRATDDAIQQAIRSRATLFLGVPCCHQDLNQQLQASGPAEVMRPLLREGILRERQAEMLTDTFRSLWLRMNGYRSEIVEFTSPEHTLRNLMLRAVRLSKPVDTEFATREFQVLKAFWGVDVWLEKLAQNAKADSVTRVG